MAKLASAFFAGCALATAFAAPLSRVPSLSPLALLVLPFFRPAAASRTRVALGIALLVGVLLTHARRHAAALDGARLEVLHPDGPTETSTGKSDSNVQSVLLLLRSGAFEALLTGDALTEMEETLLTDRPSDLELLKVGHHGSNTSTSPQLLAKSSPELAVICVGARHRYGHPHSEVMNRLHDTGVRVLHTDLAGHIRVRARRGGLFEVRTRW